MSYWSAWSRSDRLKHELWTVIFCFHLLLFWRNRLWEQELVLEHGGGWTDWLPFRMDALSIILRLSAAQQADWLCNMMPAVSHVRLCLQQRDRPFTVMLSGDCAFRCSSSAHKCQRCLYGAADLRHRKPSQLVWLNDWDNCKYLNITELKVKQQK